MSIRLFNNPNHLHHPPLPSWTVFPCHRASPMGSCCIDCFQRVSCTQVFSWMMNSWVWKMGPYSSDFSYWMSVNYMCCPHWNTWVSFPSSKCHPLWSEVEFCYSALFLLQTKYNHCYSVVIIDVAGCMMTCISAVVGCFEARTHRWMNWHLNVLTEWGFSTHVFHEARCHWNWCFYKAFSKICSHSLHFLLFFPVKLYLNISGFGFFSIDHQAKIIRSNPCLLPKYEPLRNPSQFIELSKSSSWEHNFSSFFIRCFSEYWHISHSVDAIPIHRCQNASNSHPVGKHWQMPMIYINSVDFDNFFELIDEGLPGSLDS